jgi:hypothetical protein
LVLKAGTAILALKAGTAMPCPYCYGVATRDGTCSPGAVFFRLTAGNEVAGLARVELATSTFGG